MNESRAGHRARLYWVTGIAPVGTVADPTVIDRAEIIARLKQP
jgi:hypothetical protein